MDTHWSWGRDRIHRGSPSPDPASSSTMLWKRRLRSRWSSPSSRRRLLWIERPGSSFQSECLWTTSTSAHRAAQWRTEAKGQTFAAAVTDAADSGRVQLKVRWAVAAVASRDVDAHPVNADGRVGTFIDIWGGNYLAWKVVWFHHKSKVKPGRDSVTQCEKINIVQGWSNFLTAWPK